MALIKEIEGEEIRITDLNLEMYENFGQYALFVKFITEGEEVEVVYCNRDTDAFIRYQDTEQSSKKEYLFNYFNDAIEALIEDYFNNL